MRLIGSSDDRHCQHVHRVLNRARWPVLRSGRRLRRLPVGAFLPTGPAVTGIDEIVERRCGERTLAKGIFGTPYVPRMRTLSTARGCAGSA